MTKVIMRMKIYVFLDILTILHKVGIGTHGTKILLKCNSSTSLLRSPELKNLLEFKYLPDKSWNLI